MTQRPKYLDMSAAYPSAKAADELAGEWGSYVFYRPVSLWLTPWLVRAGISANAVTWFSLVLVVALPFIAALPVSHAYVYVSLTAIVVEILDCADGAVARATDSTSRRGHYLDAIADILCRVSLYLCIGILIEGLGRSGSLITDHAAALALASALIAIVARLSRVYAALVFEAAPETHGGAGEPTPLNRAYRAGFRLLSGLDHLTAILLLGLGMAGRIDLLLAWLIVYSLVDFTHTQASIWLKLG